MPREQQANTIDDVGVEDQILEIIQKQIENTNYLGKSGTTYNRPRPQVDQKKTEF